MPRTICAKVRTLGCLVLNLGRADRSCFLLQVFIETEKTSPFQRTLIRPVKASYEWLRIQHLPGTQTNVLGVEFVTTFHAIDQGFH